MCIQSYSYLTNYREYTSSLIKTLILPLNCKKLKLFFQNEAPRIKPHPKDHSQCSRRASVSTVSTVLWHEPSQRITSYHMWYSQTSVVMKSIINHENFSSTVVIIQNMVLPLATTFDSLVFFFQKNCKSITHVAWKNRGISLSLFSESTAGYYHPRVEWRHKSCRLLCCNWRQVLDLRLNLIWTFKRSIFQHLLPLPVLPSISFKMELHVCGT